MGYRRDMIIQALNDAVVYGVKGIGLSDIPLELINRESSLPVVTAAHFPKELQGVNLGNYSDYSGAYTHGPVMEHDIRLIAYLGFNAVRLAVDYRWLCPGYTLSIYSTSFIKQLDFVISKCLENDIYVVLDYHVERLTSDLPPISIEDSIIFNREILKMFERRYNNIPNSKLAIDVVNEPYPPSGYSTAEYVQQFADAVMEVNPGRLCLIETYDSNVFENYDNVVLSYHPYNPHQVTHYRNDPSITPAWPYTSEGVTYNREWLRNVYMKAYAPGVRPKSIWLGEFGVIRYCPVDVAVAYLEDFLSVCDELELGWCVWSWRDGDFGFVNSFRKDSTQVTMPEYQGFKVDKEILNVLQGHLHTGRAINRL